MQCHECKQEMGNGKFYSNCGAVLQEDEVITSNASAPITTSIQTLEPDATKEPKSKEIVEEIKEEIVNFGYFFIRILKSPSQSQSTNSIHWISGLIMLIIFALFISLGSYITISSVFRTSFVDSFLMPFIQLILLFGIITVLTFTGLKIGAQTTSFLDVLAKVGAYAIPFFLLSILGTILALINLPFSGSIIILSLIGPLLLIPTFIILENPVNKFDQIYILIGIYILILIISSYLSQSALLGGFSPF